MSLEFILFHLMVPSLYKIMKLFGRCPLYLYPTLSKQGYHEVLEGLMERDGLDDEMATDRNCTASVCLGRVLRLVCI